MTHVIAGCSANRQIMLDWWDIDRNNFDYDISIPVIKTQVSPLEAAHQAIDYITTHYPSPYVLLLSGGMDSQAMLYAWYTSGKQFSPVSFTYNEFMNRHDLETMPVFLQTNNIYLDIQYVDLDVLEFYKQEYFSYVEEYHCGSPHICVYMKMISLFPNSTVILSGDLLKYPFIPMTKNIWSLYHYSVVTQKNVIPYFFLETADLAWSFYNVSHKNFVHKSEFYKQSGFPVIEQRLSDNWLRKSVRYSGFEKIKEYYDQHYAHLVKPSDKLARISTQNSSRVFDLLLRNKFERKYSLDKYSVRYNYA